LNAPLKLLLASCDGNYGKSLAKIIKPTATTMMPNACNGTAVLTQLYLDSTVDERQQILNAIADGTVAGAEAEALIDNMPGVLICDAEKMFNRFSRTRAFRASSEHPTLSGLTAMAAFMYSTRNNVVYYNSRDEGFTESGFSEAGAIGDKTAGSLSYLLLHNDMLQVNRLEHAKGNTNTAATAMADNVTVFGSFRQLIEYGMRLAMLEGRAFEFNYEDFVMLVTTNQPLLGASVEQIRDILTAACERIVGNDSMSRVWEVTQGLVLLGIPVGNPEIVETLIQKRVERHCTMLEMLHQIPELDPATAHTLIRGSLVKRNDHYAASLPILQMEKASLQCDEATVAFYSRCIDKAGVGGGGDIKRRRTRINDAAREFMWLPVSADGMGLHKLGARVLSGVYLAGVRSALDISRDQRHCIRPLIAAHVQADHTGTHKAFTPADIIANFHKHVRSRPELSVSSAKRSIPHTIEQFIDSKAGPRRVQQALQGASRRAAIESANTMAADDHSGDDNASFQRSVQARCARSCVENGSDVFHLPRGRRQTSATGTAFLLAFFTFAGIPIPGVAGLVGQQCGCRKTPMDTEHPYTCGINGRWHIHNRVRDVVARLVSRHGSSDMKFVCSEPRGKDFHISVDSQIGPDGEFRYKGNRLLVDYSGIADSRNVARHLFQARCTHTDQHNISLAEALAAGADETDRILVDPVGKRDRTKFNGAVGKLCAEQNIAFVPCTFINSGGISSGFDEFLVKAFSKDDTMAFGQWGTSIRSTLQYARHTITATIVNAHAEYVIGNMRSAFAARGKRGVEMAWWHANNFPQHRFADVFDDVMEDVLARGVIGDEADGDRVRGAVGV